MDAARSNRDGRPDGPAAQRLRRGDEGAIPPAIAAARPVAAGRMDADRCAGAAAAIAGQDAR